MPEGRSDRDMSHPSPDPTTPMDAAVRKGGAPRADAPADYNLRLARRIGAVVVFVLAGAALSWVTLRTVRGQVVDTVAMAAVVSSLGSNDAVTVLRRIGRTLVSVPSAVIVATLVTAVAVLRRRPTLAARALVVVVGANATTQLLKRLVDRPELGVTGFLDNSLPSGHVTFIASFAVALVIVAPGWMRSACSFAAWAATTFMGVTVMAVSWHRPSDVLVAILVVGTWGLTLAPLEVRRRRLPQVSRWAGIAAVVALVAGVVLLAAGTPGALDALSEAPTFDGVPGHLDAQAFLEGHLALMRVLALGSALSVAGLAGLVIHEVDRLARD